jgi:hypothetical protein
MTMSPDERPEERVCPVCETRLPDDPAVRRCPRCGARALQWARQQPLGQGVVLFNARLAGMMAGAFVAMLSLLVLGYRFPIPWQVAFIAIALPVAGYIAFGALAVTVPRSWRTQYMVGVLAFTTGLLVATIAGLVGILNPLTLLGITAAVTALVWPMIRRAVTDSMSDQQ